jgi:hypothetical protein
LTEVEAIWDYTFFLFSVLGSGKKSGLILWETNSFHLPRRTPGIGVWGLPPFEGED